MAELFRVAIKSTGPIDQVVNTFYLRGDNPTSPDVFSHTPSDVADQVDTKLTGPYRGILASNYTLDSYTVSTVENPNDENAIGEQAQKFKGLAGSRTPADFELPAPVCGMIKLGSSNPGRSYRGRMFLPPLESRADIASNVIVTSGTYGTNVTAFIAALDDFLSSNGGVTYESGVKRLRLVIYSRTRHARAASPYWVYCNSISFSSVVRFLRSRRS